MKKTLMMVLCIALCASCAAKRQVQQPVQQPVQQTVVEDDDAAAEIKRLQQELELQKLKNELKKEQLKADREMAAIEAAGVEIEIPCIESSFDDEYYFRDYGVAPVEGDNKQGARLAAAKSAKQIIKARLGEFIQGMTTDYSNLYGGSLGTDTERKLESKLNGVVEKMLNDADHECEKLFVNHKGILEYTYVVRIPKEDLKKEMINVLSKDEKLGIDFKESQMQEFIDQRMEKMQEAKKNAGY